MWLGAGCSEGKAQVLPAFSGVKAERPCRCVRAGQESEPAYDRCGRVQTDREKPGQHKPGPAAQPPLAAGKAGQEGGDVTTMTEAQKASAMPETAAHDAEARPMVAGAEASVWTERMLSALVNGVVVPKARASSATAASGSV